MLKIKENRRIKKVGLERKLQLYYSKLVEKLSKNGQWFPDQRPSAVVNVATDWFTIVRLKYLLKCTVGF